MGIGLDRPERLAPLLWVLLVLFAARVSGQALVAFLDVRFLPPMQEWYSGLLAYEYLLPAQIAIVTLKPAGLVAPYPFSSTGCWRRS